MADQEKAMGKTSDGDTLKDSDADKWYKAASAVEYQLGSKGYRPGETQDKDLSH